MSNEPGDVITDKKYGEKLLFGQGIATEANLNRSPNRFINESAIERAAATPVKPAEKKIENGIIDAELGEGEKALPPKKIQLKKADSKK